MKKLTKFALLIGAIAVAAKIIGSKREEWTGLTEAQVRDKIDSRMPDRIPDQKRAKVADRVVETMRSRGVLAEDDAPATDEAE